MRTPRGCPANVFDVTGITPIRTQNAKKRPLPTEAKRGRRLLGESELHVNLEILFPDVCAGRGGAPDHQAVTVLRDEN
jgi:hypothetical protein